MKPKNNAVILDKKMKKEKDTNTGGRRYNKGKLRYELISGIALEEIAKVYTAGAEKYTDYAEDGSITYDGSNNWRKGLKWMDCIASAKRHIEKFVNGTDVDEETSTLHLANACWNLMSILDFYKTYPQGDDRIKRFVNNYKIGLDIDEVLADWVTAWMERFNIKAQPESWYFDREIMARFEEMKKNGELDKFYLGLKPLIKPSDLPFEPHCYITSRPVSTEITQKWLDMHNFPAVPVYTVDLRKSKAEVAKEAGINVFIDDSYSNFLNLNREGILTYLFDRKHNERFDVGHLRISSLKDLPIIKV